MKWKSFFLLFVILVGYLLIGGLVFHLLEINTESNCNLGQRIDAILTDYEDVIADVNSTNQSQRQDLMQALRLASDCRVANTTVSQMSFSDGVYLSLTTMAAIGYGYFYPKTIGGRVAAIVYCFTAVPLFLLTSVVIGEKMQRVKAKLLTDDVFVKWKIMNHKLRLAIKMVLLFAIGQVVFLIVPAVGVMYLESWSYFDAYYFLVVTFLTVGFGDLNAAAVVDKPYIQAYRVVYYFWTLLGISFIALIIQTIVDALRTEAGQLEEKMARLSAIVQEAAAPPVISGHYRIRRLESIMETADPAPLFKKKGSNAFFFGSSSAFGANPNIRRSSAGLPPRDPSFTCPPPGSATPNEDPLPTLIEEEEEELEDGAPNVNFSSASSDTSSVECHL